MDWPTIGAFYAVYYDNAVSEFFLLGLIKSAFFMAWDFL